MTRGTRRELSSDLAVCVWIPLFALRCEEERRPELRAHPTALLAPDDTRRLWQISSRARQAGVKPGMTVSQAVGLCASLALWEADPVHYDEQFARLLRALRNVSPVLEPVELGRVYVGVDGLEGLYGSPAEQVQNIVQATAAEWERVRRMGRFGWAQGKFAAWVAATRAKPGETVIVAEDQRIAFLASQPIAVLPIDADTHRRLWQLGIKQLRDITSLPEVAVVSQFGSAGRQLWRLATGVAIDPVVGRQPPEPIRSEIDLPCPVADQAMLVHALERLIERALRDPRRVGWRVLEVRVRARQEQGVSWMTCVILKDPSADRDHIIAPIKTRLVQTPPAGAVETLAVEFTDFVRGTDELQLFARDAASAARAGQRRALRAAVREIKLRFRRSGLYHIVEVHPWSRIPERRYALIDYDP